MQELVLAGDDMENKHAMIIGLLMVVILGLGYLAFSKPSEQTFYVGPTPPERDTVTVNGEASASVAPDLGLVSLSVETNRSTAQASQEANAEVVQEIKQALLFHGIREMDMETVSFSVQPVYRSRYQCPEGGTTCPNYDRIYTQEITGYMTTHRLRVKVQQVEDTGEIADVIVEEGGDETQVDSISFDLKDGTRDELEMQLLQQAATNARNKAQRLADGLDVTLGGPTSVTESVQYPTYYRSYDYELAGVAAAPAPTEVFGGQIEVTAQVSASFLID